MLTPQTDDIFRDDYPPTERARAGEREGGGGHATAYGVGEGGGDRSVTSEADALARLPTGGNTSLPLESGAAPANPRAPPLPPSMWTTTDMESHRDPEQGAALSTSLTAAAEMPADFPVKMNVESSFRGNEGLRSITYFLIRTTTESTISPPPGIEALGQPPKTVPPHLRSLFSGVGLVQWNPGKEVMIQRRYSEASMLRELLSYQFPHLLIPPLRAKGMAENWDSYLNKEDASYELTFKLQFFLQQLMGIPTVIFMSEYVQAFATDPRDTFETVTLPRMQEKLKAYQRANKPVVDFSGQQRDFSSSATNVIVNASTKTIKSVVNFFTGYRGTSGSEEAGISHPSFASPSSQDAQTSTAAGTRDHASVAPLATGGVNAGTGGDPSLLWNKNSTAGGSHLGGYSRSAEVTADIDYWNAVSITLAVTRNHLKDAAIQFNQYLAHTNKAEAAMQTAAEAAKGFSAELRAFGLAQTTVPLTSVSSSSVTTDSPSPSPDVRTDVALLPPLEEGFEALSYTLSETIDIRRRKRRQQFMDVCSRLRCEADYIKVTLSRIDDILTLYAYVERANVYECMSPAWRDAMECAQEISKRFREHYEQSYKPKYYLRMKSFKKKVFGAMHDAAEGLLHYKESSSMTAYVNRIPSEVVAHALQPISDSTSVQEEGDASQVVMGRVEGSY